MIKSAGYDAQQQMLEIEFATDRSGSLIMYRRISGIAFGVTIFRNSFSIISLWDIIRNEECRKLGREPRHTGEYKQGNEIITQEAAEIAISPAASCVTK